VELSDLVDFDESSDDSSDEEAKKKKEKKEKKELKRKVSKHLVQKKKPENNLMKDLIKNSLGSFF
jgi:hypothetical protein